MAQRRFRTRPRRLRRRPRNRRIGGRKRTGTKAAVARVLHRMLENKKARYAFTDSVVNYNSATWGTPPTTGVYPATPYPTFMTVNQGLGQGDRIGNRIRTRYCALRGILLPQPYNAVTHPNPRPMEVLMLVFSRKDTPATYSALMNNIWQSGDTSFGPVSNIVDVVSRVNTDLYTLHYQRVFKIGPSINQGTGSTNTYFQIANNDFKLNQRIYVNLTKYVPKVLSFNDTGSANNRVVHVALWALSGDGTTFGSTIVPCQFTGEFMYDYEDA